MRKDINTSTLAGTIAHRNTAVASKFLLAAGYEPSRSVEEIAFKLNDYISRHGEPALEALKEIHPDRELLTPVQKVNQVAPQMQNMNAGGDHDHFNCAGNSRCWNTPNGRVCTKGCGGGHHNADGEGSERKSTNLIDQKSLMLIGMFCITAISIVALSRKGN